MALVKCQTVYINAPLPDLFMPSVLTWIAPNRHLLLRKHVKVDLGQSGWKNGFDIQIGPALYHPDQGLEGVDGQAVGGVVGHVGHEDRNLKLLQERVYSSMRH